MLSESSDFFDILVIDDEPPVSDLLTRIACNVFPQAKFIPTQSTQEAFEYIQSQTERPPQLILLDIDLRQAKDGLSFLPELQTYFKGAVPIIMLSVVDDQAKIEQAYNQGAVTYMLKPEDLHGWQNHVRILRSYWHQIASLPRIDYPLN